MACDRCIRYGNDLDNPLKHPPEDCPMPEPNIADRDRELAIKALHNSPLDKMNPRDFLVLWEQVEAVVMEARREGREEGLREAATEAQKDEDYLRHHLDDPHQADGAKRVKDRIVALLPALAREGEE